MNEQHFSVASKETKKEERKKSEMFLDASKGAKWRKYVIQIFHNWMHKMTTKTSASIFLFSSPLSLGCSRHRGRDWDDELRLLGMSTIVQNPFVALIKNNRQSQLRFIIYSLISGKSNTEKKDWSVGRVCVCMLCSRAQKRRHISKAHNEICHCRARETMSATEKCGSWILNKWKMAKWIAWCASGSLIWLAHQMMIILYESTRNGVCLSFAIAVWRIVCDVNFRFNAFHNKCNFSPFFLPFSFFSRSLPLSLSRVLHLYLSSRLGTAFLATFREWNFKRSQWSGAGWRVAVVEKRRKKLQK